MSDDEAYCTQNLFVASDLMEWGRVVSEPRSETGSTISKFPELFH
jgi:hypothetical protein